ncbi:aryl-sulfate sulfotransferase [Nocardioides dubius]|uniref:aryl-sulfate sulfotransferase n=1 Tax=Nocardioides dubius TaxID=317019 RepID=UPI0031E0FBFA
MPRRPHRLVIASAAVLVVSTAALTAPPALAAPREAPVAPRAVAAPSISVTGTGVSTYPAFSADVSRYGLRTGPGTGGTVQVRVSDVPASSLVTVNGRLTKPGTAVTLNGLGEGDEITVLVTADGATRHYTWVYLPAGFPLPQATTTGETGEGGVFLTLGSMLSNDAFATIVDDNGVPRFVRSLSKSNDFKLAPNGNYSVAVPTTTPGKSGDRIVELDAQFNEVASHETKGLVNTDFHDSVLLADGHVLLVGYEGVNGQIDATIQEQDADGEVVFDWTSADHFTPPQAQVSPMGDYAHINSVAPTADGNLIASFRNLSTVAKISRSTGEVLWRLGGKESDFTFVGDPYGGPCAQHTAYELASGNVLIFDNGAAARPAYAQTGQAGDFCPDPAATPPGSGAVARPQSRAVEYRLDEEAGTATMVWQHVPQGRFSIFAGSTQRLPNKNTMIGWAINGDNDFTQPVATEVDAAGDVVWSLRADGAISYRAFRHPAPDAIAPAITVPAAVKVAQDAVALPGFGCTDRGGSSLVRCTAPGLRGGYLDTRTRGTHTVAVTALDGAGNRTTRSFSYTVTRSAARTDLMVRRAGAPWRGAGVLTPKSPTTVSAKVAMGSRAKLRLALRNDGATATRLTLRSTAHKPGWRVRYTVGGRDITRAVLRGTWRTPRLAPGARATVTVVIARTSRKPARTFTVTARGTSSPVSTDRIAIKVR